MHLMMKNNSIILLIASMSLSACANRPVANTHAINKACSLEMVTARIAIHLRDKGKNKHAMLQTLPPLKPDSTRLLQQMHAIVLETYAVPSLNDVIYPTYRFEYCVRQLRKQPVPPNLQAVAKQLLNCQARFGTQPSQQATECIMACFARQSTSLPTRTTLYSDE
jgi:hypothetical protein